jgi:penicillin-binding protein 2
LFTIQIVSAQEYIAQADENRISDVSLPSQRGIIYDRNGYILAQNIPSYNVTITPAYLPVDGGEVQEIYRELSDLIDVPVSNGEINETTVRAFTPCQTDLGINEIVTIQDTNAPYTAVSIKCNIDEKTAMIIKEKESEWPGVGIEIQPVRDYPTGSLTADIIGFLGPVPAALKEEYEAKGFVAGRDKVGYAGVELSLQDILGGTNGMREVEVDVAGQVLRDLEAPIDPIAGNNVQLTIDTRLQAAAQAALVGEINYWNAYLNYTKSTSGVVIAMNPKTGEILAMVSYPSYENNRMARLIPSYYWEQLNQDPNKPLFNRAISGEFPPGSVFKLAAATGALNEGVITPDQKIYDPGLITILEKYSPNDPGTPRKFVCYLRTGHGYLDFLGGLKNSCDVYFYKIGGGYDDEVPNGGLGIWRLAEYAKALGYGSITGIELPGETSGLVPDPTWKRIQLGETWSTGDTYIATIGQGYVLATPLQVLVSFATIINDGVMMKPTLVEQITDADGNVVQPFQPVEVRDITRDAVIQVFDQDNQPTGEKLTVQPWVIDLIKQGMRLVVTEGTAAKAFVGADELLAAGKTGTAEYCDDVARAKNLCQPENWPQHAWFVGYAPYNDPEIAVVAFVYNGGEGASVAAPIVRRVLEAYFELKTIDTSTTIGE